MIKSFSDNMEKASARSIPYSQKSEPDAEIDKRALLTIISLLMMSGGITDNHPRT